MLSVNSVRRAKLLERFKSHICDSIPGRVSVWPAWNGFCWNLLVSCWTFCERAQCATGETRPHSWRTWTALHSPPTETHRRRFWIRVVTGKSAGGLRCTGFAYNISSDRHEAFRWVCECYLHGEIMCLWAGDGHICTDDDDVTNTRSDAKAQSPWEPERKNRINGQWQ